MITRIAGLLAIIGLVSSQNVSSVRYLLWTRSNPDDSSYYEMGFLDENSLNMSPFVGDRKTYFVYHGWSDQGLNSFIRKAKTDILSIEDANFISVDWEEMASNSLYDRAVDNMYEVANRTAEMINWLTDQTTLSLENIHIWGHSLGGQCSGMTAYYFQSFNKGKVARVSGLDPAGPLFMNKDPTERIDSSHAIFVDILHTDAITNGSRGGAGLYESVGHADFYPNKGVLQPGCGGSAADIASGCSHARAPDYFVESILGPTPFTAYPCNSLDDVEAGTCLDCSSGCEEMGFHTSTSARGIFYLITNAESPFAVG